MITRALALSAILILLVVWIASVSGCATTEDRWLTKQEDADMRAYCEPQGGCMLVPMPIWEQIKRRLGLTDT